MNGQSIDREKIFVDCISENEWLLKIYKELIQLNSKNKNRHKTKKQQKTWLKIGQMAWIDIFPKKIYKWPTVIWKDAQYH